MARSTEARLQRLEEALAARTLVVVERHACQSTEEVLAQLPDPDGPRLVVILMRWDCPTGRHTHTAPAG